MLAINHISTKSADWQQDMQAVVNIEKLVQQHEAWSYPTLMQLLSQDSVKLLIAANTTREVQGYCLYQLIFEQAEILRIGTHPDYQRQGIASQLFATLNNELQANEVESLLLEVRADNAPAIALYHQQGFDVIHRREGYYQHPHKPAMDALIMQLNYIEKDN